MLRSSNEAYWLATEAMVMKPRKLGLDGRLGEADVDPIFDYQFWWSAIDSLPCWDAQLRI